MAATKYEFSLEVGGFIVNDIDGDATNIVPVLHKNVKLAEVEGNKIVLHVDAIPLVFVCDGINIYKDARGIDFTEFDKRTIMRDIERLYR